MKEKKILLIVQNNSFPFDKRVYREAMSLARNGFSVYVISPVSKQDKLKYEVFNCIKVFRYRNFESKGGLWGFFWEYFNSLLWIYLISFFLIISKNIKVVHVANPPDFFWPLALIVKVFNVKFIYDQHDLAPKMFETKFSNKFISNFLVLCENYSIKFSSGIIVVNDTFKELLKDRVDRQPIAVVYNGPEDDFKPIFNEGLVKKYKGYKVVLYVGLMTKNDNIEVIIEAATILIKQFNRTDLKFVLVGDGDVRCEMETKVSDLGMDNYFEFTGLLNHEKVKEYLYIADVCVAPDKPNNLNEYLTLVKVLEYMKSGKAFVAFNLEETMKVAGPSGLYAVSIADFANKINLLLNNSELRAKLGSKGEERILSKYLWKFQEKKLLALYHNVIYQRHHFNQMD